MSRVWFLGESYLPHYKLLFMQKHFLSILFLVWATDSYSTTRSPFKDLCADQVFFNLPGTRIRISLVDYILLKPSDFKKLTGHKLNWKETIGFRSTQKQIKRTIRKNGTVDMVAFERKAKEPFKWHWGGFFLGILLPIVGMIISAFIKDDKRKNRTNSAAIGTLVACVAFFIVIIVNLSDGF